MRTAIIRADDGRMFVAKFKRDDLLSGRWFVIGSDTPTADPGGTVVAEFENETELCKATLKGGHDDEST